MADVFSERRRQAYARLDAVLRELDELDPPEWHCQGVGAEGAALDDGVAGLSSTPETCEGGVKRRRRAEPEDSNHAASNDRPAAACRSKGVGNDRKMCVAARFELLARSALCSDVT
eukprot:7385435-Prymnesium_polylepis.1